MSSKGGTNLLRTEYFFFNTYKLHYHMQLEHSWHQCITVKLFHIIMKWNGSNITMRLLHIIMKWNLSDFIFLWRNSLPYWKTKYCQKQKSASKEENKCFFVFFSFLMNQKYTTSCVVLFRCRVINIPIYLKIICETKPCWPMRGLELIIVNIQPTHV